MAPTAAIRRMRAGILLAAAAAVGSWGVAAGVERVAARAGSDSVGVADGESAAHEGIHEVDFGALQVHAAEAVDEQLDAFGFDDGVVLFSGVLDGHAILQTGATTGRN